MSVRNTVRALPTLVRVGFAEAVAYRAELVVWILSTTMPLIMMALFSTVAKEAPIGRFDERGFVAYFLATFLVRQLTGSWAAWQMNYEVRQGTLAMRLLRPVHPIVAWAVENLAALPLRLVIAVPVASAMLLALGRDRITHDPRLWVCWVFALVGAWLITFLANAAIGCLSFFLESSLKVMDLWLVLFFVFSGYLVPVELFPASVRAVTDLLPFRYQVGLPVEIMTGAHDLPATLHLLAMQWAHVGVFLAATVVLWRAGLARFAAYGG